MTAPTDTDNAALIARLRRNADISMVNDESANAIESLQRDLAAARAEIATHNKLRFEDADAAIESLMSERKDWARRFKLNDVTPWEWMSRAVNAERDLAHEQSCMDAWMEKLRSAERDLAAARAEIERQNERICTVIEDCKTAEAREITGYINGLIFCGNLKPRIPRGEEGSNVLNDIRAQIDAAIQQERKP